MHVNFFFFDQLKQMVGQLAQITLLKSWTLVLFDFYGLWCQKIKPNMEADS